MKQSSRQSNVSYFTGVNRAMPPGTLALTGGNMRLTLKSGDQPVFDVAAVDVTKVNIFYPRYNGIVFNIYLGGQRYTMRLEPDDAHAQSTLSVSSLFRPWRAMRADVQGWQTALEQEGVRVHNWGNGRIWKVLIYLTIPVTVILVIAAAIAALK